MRMGREPSNYKLSLGKALLGVTLAIFGLIFTQCYDKGVTVERAVLSAKNGDLKVPVIFVRSKEASATAPTAILGHGLASSKETMLCLAERLAQSGFHCVCLDFPGHGASSVSMKGQDGSLSLEVAAEALTEQDPPKIPIDLYIGHSRGGALGSEAISKQRIKARLFIALGSFAAPKRSANEALLYVTGRYDVLAPPKAFETWGRYDNHRELVISESADHVTELWDPTCIDACVDWALSKVQRPKSKRSWNGVLRALGSVLLLFGALIISLSVSKPAGPLKGFEISVVVVLTVMLYFTALFFGVGRCFMGLNPTLRQVPFLVLSWSALFALSITLGQTASRARATKYSASLGQSCLVILSVLSALSLFLQKQGVLALLMIILSIMLLGSLALSAILERHWKDSLVAHGVFAVMIGYLPGQWLTLFII